jgi:thymidylate synthase (FAD)
VKYSGIEAVVPNEITEPFPQCLFINALKQAEDAYLKLLDAGLKPEIARGVLPTALKTEIAVTANLREWRHIFEMRCSQYAHPQIRLVMIELLKQAKEVIPVIFDDFKIDEDKKIAFTINNERAD